MIYSFANLELDTRSFELRRAGTGDVIAMEPQVFDVLCFLVEHADRLVTKEQLLDSVWGTRFVTESALTSRIKDARKAVGDDGRSQHVIRTVHGRGYRLVATVTGGDGRDNRGARRAPASPLGGPTLLERDDELATLEEVLESARTHRGGRVVLVAGEAGQGKTALVRAFADAARAQGVRVPMGGCDNLTTPRTMGPLRDIAHDLGGSLGDVFTTDPDVERLFSVLLDVLAEEPTILVMEDLHWADDATLDVVRFLGRRIADLPAALIVTYRDEGLGTSHRLRRVLGGLAGTSVRRMSLSPLSLEAVGQLAEQVGVPADELHTVTRGNPFFVTEVLATGELRVPPTVRDAVLSRVDTLSPDTRRLLEHAAVIPSRADRALLARLVDDAHLATAEAEEAGVLNGDERAVWFRHELARQAVEESLTAAARTRANQRVLGVLVEDASAEPARLVHHASRAGDAAALVAHLPVAAADAIHLGAYSEAAQHLELLLRQSDLPDRTVAVGATQLSYVLYMRNRFADSARSGTLSVTAAERSGDAAVLADALLRLSRTLYWSDGPRAAAAAVERAMPLVEGLADEARLAAAHAELARVMSDLVTVGPVAEPSPTVVEHADRSLELARRLGDSYLQCHALQYRGTGRIGLGDLGGVDDLAQAVELAELDPRDEMPTRACVNAAGGCFRAGRLDDAERYALLGIERTGGGEFTAGVYRLELTRHSVQLCRGDWNEAEAGLRMLVDWPGEPGIMRPLAASLLVRLLAREGRHEEAAAVLAPATATTAGSEEIALVGPVAVAAVEAAWCAERAEESLGLAVPAMTLAVELGHRSTASELTRYLQRAGHAVDALLDPVGPWAPGIAGRWRDAAEAWAAHGCRFERAVELASAPDSAAKAEGCRELELLGASGTLAAL